MDTKYTFATRDGKAYYCNSIPGFIKDNPERIIGTLVRKAFEINKEQSNAWDNQISELQDRLEACGMQGDIIFEYDIVRLGKRIDVILLIKDMVFSLEFKNGKKIFEAQDARQAEDYAIDIKNFHKASKDLYVCPILIATKASKYKKEQSTGCYSDKQIFLQRENMETLTNKLQEIIGKYGGDKSIDFDEWFYSPYYPTPTIVSAAVEAYKYHDVSSIAQSEAGQKEIDKCEEAIKQVIEETRKQQKKSVCFVTGVPGAGKTLVGLDIVSRSLNKDNLSVYLSGNGPLVKVLREALKRSVKSELAKANKETRRETEAAINALIQSGYGFKLDNVASEEPTPEHIMIFDEAQRVWNESKMKRKHREDPSMHVSEPHLLYSIMDRHDDWAVMICLVGLGQDIYDGEVGIGEWFKCGIEEFKDWDMYYSSEILNQIEDDEFDINKIKNCDRCHVNNDMHLRTSIRSFRADKQSVFVDSLLNNEPQKAKEILNEIKEQYPVYITRDVSKAKKWAKKQVRGTQRCGMLASSGAMRLRSEGIYAKNNIDVEHWFLDDNEDVRSSNMMEVVASEFDIQGLEIDWAVVCWDADLRRNKNEWNYYNFRGSRWERRNADDRQRYLVNSYRVLLTRARQGMVLFVPRGVDREEDKTRDHIFYDGIYDYLVSCGIEELKDD